MFYSHSEISMMSKSHINDIRESYKKNYDFNEEKKENRKSLLQVLLVTKVFTFINK